MEVEFWAGDDVGELAVEMEEWVSVILTAAKTWMVADEGKGDGFVDVIEKRLWWWRL